MKCQSRDRNSASWSKLGCNTSPTIIDLCSHALNCISEEAGFTHLTLKTHNAVIFMSLPPPTHT